MLIIFKRSASAARVREPPAMYAGFGLNPDSTYYKSGLKSNIGDVAQLGERCFRTAEAEGSNPFISNPKLTRIFHRKNVD